MTAKSLYSDPLPGDRFARRLIGEINRNIGPFPTDHGEAVDLNDQRLIQEVNQTRTAIESTANELRTMTDISDMMRNRVTDALNRAADILNRYQPIQFEIRGAKAQNGGTDEVRNPPPPTPQADELHFVKLLVSRKG